MANQFEALIARIRQQPSWGFEHQHLKIPLDPGSLSGEKVEPIGIVWSPLSPVDYGLVPVAERIAYAPKLQSSRMTITPSGILQPVAPPTEKNKTPVPFLIEPIYENGKRQPDHMNVYGFPPYILRWALGLPYAPHFIHPQLLGGSEVQFFFDEFDREKRVYIPDEDRLRRMRYTDEGVKRQFMLGLQTQLISLANGSDVIEIDTQTMSVDVMVSGKGTNLETPDGKVQAIRFSLHGIKALVEDCVPQDISSIIHLPITEPDALVPQIVKICILLIAQDLERRPGLIEGVRSTFTDFP